MWVWDVEGCSNGSSSCVQGLHKGADVCKEAGKGLPLPNLPHRGNLLTKPCHCWLHVVCGKYLAHHELESVMTIMYYHYVVCSPFCANVCSHVQICD